LNLRAGEILALIGPNGAGKSTCFDMLNGQNTPGQRPHHAARRRKRSAASRARSGGSASGAPSRSPRRSDHDGARERAGRAGVVWQAIVQSLGLDGKLRARRAGRLLDLVGMGAYAGRPVRRTRLWRLKRLELAIALANQPKLLLMDEPTAGMAPRERIELMRLTARIAREQSIGVLFTEHDMEWCSNMPTASWC
jgi:branched-chain amino acid transport system ATP-binding protein